MSFKSMLYGFNQSFALFFFRVSVGLMMGFGHGLTKLTNFNQMSLTFFDPFNVGSSVSLALAIFGEFFCSIALVLGLFTRPAALFSGVAMATAFFLAHAQDPYARKELALLYLVCYITIFIAGPGRYSVDAKMARGGG